MMEFATLEEAKAWARRNASQGRDVRVKVGDYLYTLGWPDTAEAKLRRRLARDNRTDLVYRLAGWACMVAAVVLVVVILGSML